MVKCIIWKDSEVAFTAERFDSDEFKLGRLHEKHAVIT
jgi:hypothetical protein